MLQLVYLSIVAILILTILWKYGIMNLPFIALTGLILAVLIILLWVYRGSYTRNIRDKKNWQRRRFEGDGSMPPAVSPEAVSEEAKKRIAAYEAAVAAGKACPRV